MTAILGSLADSLHGIAIFAEVHALANTAALRVEKLTEEFNFSQPFAKQLVSAARTWATYQDPEGKTEAIPVQQLILIAKAVELTAAEDKDTTRDTLLDYAYEGHTWKEMKARIADTHRTVKTRKVSDSVTVSAVADACGMKHAHIKLEALKMDRFIGILAEASTAPGDLPESFRWAQGLNRIVQDYEDGVCGTASTRLWNRRLAPAFMLAVPDSTYIGDGKFATTDGEILDADDITKCRLEPYGFAVMYDGNNKLACTIPLKNERFADGALRTGIACDQIFCSHPGCYRIGVYSQAHHVKSYASGGETTEENIIVLCKYHNGQNDDDPTKPKHGRHERDPVNGDPRYIPPDGGPPRYHDSPCRGYTGRDIARNILKQEAENTDDDE
ncbi:HNH endonuclease signature motif containing protein [uncultured Corynebacterium sp.]|uniref:HNH endonuclease signature motif containing protein n=1 Tax=uncultured Corynebacterium sp. TaxID=159447 RepID=UPI00262A2693|nr:HNH endonuclease signature motif containing protein [uncultured Corynebacterium sp.]